MTVLSSRGKLSQAIQVIQATKSRQGRTKEVREHQIAISLKPQQFELLQRLARERGFKSVTAYVKQKIVELALGLDSDLPAAEAEAAQYGASQLSGGLPPENLALHHDLTRIHNELRAFVGRSPEDLMAGGNAAAASAPAAFDLPPPGHIGPVNEGSHAAGDLRPFPTAPPQPATPPVNTSDSQVVSSQVLPSNNLGGFGFRLGGFAGGGATSRFQPPVDNSDRLSGYREIMDDLEELADRAFAISPRLGALDEEAPDEAATGRGGRSAPNSILVEPILPAASEVKGKVKGAPVAPSQANPISMVPPISATDLAGPGDVAVAAPSAQVSDLAAAAAPSAQVSDLAAAPEIASAAVSETTSQAEAAAQPQAEIDPGEPPPAPTEIDSTGPPQPVARAPLPGDDLLSELLDESLVAHAEAPRPADNPFAVDLGFAKVSSESSGTIIDASAGSPPFVDPEESEQQSRAGQIDEEQPASADLPVAESGEGPAGTSYNDSEREEQSQSNDKGSSRAKVKDDPQDPHVPGHSNLGSGPPPKRRRT